MESVSPRASSIILESAGVRKRRCHIAGVEKLWLEYGGHCAARDITVTWKPHDVGSIVPSFAKEAKLGQPNCGTFGKAGPAPLEGLGSAGLILYGDVYCH
jgi:hypothetical protein